MTEPTEPEDSAGGSKPKRPAPVSWRPPHGREREFARMVAASGLSANAFITQAVFRSRNRVERVQLARLLKEAQDIRDELAQLRLEGAAGNALAIEQAEQTLIAIAAGILRLMGRRGIRQVSAEAGTEGER